MASSFADYGQPPLPDYSIYQPINVKTYGAVGNGKFAQDGVITAGSTTATSASAGFTQDDVGKNIQYHGGGVGDVDLYTTIASVQSATSITLTDAASVSKTNNRFFWGGTDDTGAIQAAINAADSTKAALYVPAGVYLISSELTYNANLRRIFGDGARGSWLKSVSPSTLANIIHFTDCRTFQMDSISFRGPGLNAVGGGKVFFDRLNQSNVARLGLYNVIIEDVADDGLAISIPITTYLLGVEIVFCSGNGFNIYGGGTSTGFYNCLAATVTKSGFLINGEAYVALHGCASEGAGIAYEILNSFNVSALSCGCESQVNRSAPYPGHGWKIDGGEEIQLINCYSRDLPVATVNHFLITGSAKRVLISTPRTLDGATAVTNHLQIDAGCDDVVIDLPNFATSKILDNSSGGASIRTADKVGVRTVSPGASLDAKGSGAGRVLCGELAGVAAYGAIGLAGSLAVTLFTLASSPTDQDLYINRPAGKNIRIRENNAFPDQITIAPGNKTGFNVGVPTEVVHVGGNVRSVRIMTIDGILLVAADFALSAGWGLAASVAVGAFSTDQRGMITVTSAGVGQGVNPTITLTFKDGAWPLAPFALSKMEGGTGAITNTTETTTTTTLVITFLGTPVATLTYTFDWIIMG